MGDPTLVHRPDAAGQPAHDSPSTAPHQDRCRRKPDGLRGMSFAEGEAALAPEVSRPCAADTLKAVHHHVFGDRERANKAVAEAARIENDGGSLAKSALEAAVTSAITGVAGALAAWVGSRIADPLLKGSLKKAVSGASSLAATRAAASVASGWDTSKPPSEAERGLFFLAIEQAIADEKLDSELALIDSPIHHPQASAEDLLAATEQLDAMKADIAQLQYRESRAAWFSYLAQRKLGTASETAGVATKEGGKGGTALSVAPTNEAMGVLQVAVDKANMTTIVSAHMPGRGTIRTADFATTPLSGLKVPVRFEVETPLGTRAAIFVNEQGRAWYEGRGVEELLHRLGGGPPLARGERVDPNERHFVESGLQRYVATMMGKRLHQRYVERTP